MPETLGTICYLSKKKYKHLKKRLLAGYVLTCLGIGNSFTYKSSRLGNSRGDRIVKRLLRKKSKNKIISFTPIGRK